MAAMSKISAVFAADTGGLELGVKRAGLALRNMGADVASLRSRLGTLTAIQGAQLFGGLVNYAQQATKALSDMGSRASESIDKMGKLAQGTGLTYAEFAGLAHAGDLAGVSMDSLSTAISKSDKVFVDAQRGSKSAQDAFAAIGLSVDQLVGKTGAERFAIIADGINSLPDPAQKSAAAMRIFGESAARMMPLFEGGAASIRAASQEAERFGLTLSQNQTQSVFAMNDAWTRVQASIRGVVDQVVANLAPGVQVVFDTLSNFISSAGGANIGANIADAFFAGAEVLAAGIDYAYETLVGAWKYAGAVVDVFAGVSWAFGKVWTLASSLIGGFQGILSVATGAIAAVTQGLLVGAAKLADLLGFEGVADTLRRASQQAGEASTAALNVAGNQLIGAGEQFGEVFLGAAGKVGEALERPAGQFSDMLEKAKQASLDARSNVGDVAAKAVAVSGDLAASKMDAAGEAMKAAALQADAELVKRMKQSENAIAAAGKSISTLDTRSSEGVNALVRLKNQQGSDVEREQLRELKKMREDLRSAVKPEFQEVNL